MENPDNPDIQQQSLNTTSSQPSTVTMEIKVSDDGESLFEAYHAIFSWLTSTKDIYTRLANICGSKFTYSTEKKILSFKEDFIFCKKADATHYKFFQFSTQKIFDPYEYFQLYNSHGNCFAYALYFSSILTGTGSSINLINISDFIEEVTSPDNKKYLKVKNSEKQKAYQCFVYNDYSIINWLLELIKQHQDIINIYSVEWGKIEENEKKEYGIPLDKSYTFDIYFQQFCDMAKNMDNTYTMTWDQITNWDNQAGSLKPHENSGIENAETDINKSDYKIDQEELDKLPRKMFMGGKKSRTKKSRNKKSRTKKSRTKKSRNKN